MGVSEVDGRLCRRFRWTGRRTGPGWPQLVTSPYEQLACCQGPIGQDKGRIGTSRLVKKGTSLVHTRAY